MKLCISTGILTFLIVLYCCIGIDFLPEFIDEELIDHPLVRFVVLALMALVFCYDHYIAILIGFIFQKKVIVRRKRRRHHQRTN